MVYISPRHESSIGQNGFFVIISQMFEYQIHIRIVSMNFIPNAKPIIHPRLVVLVPIRDVVGLILGKSFTQIKSKSIYFVFLHPILHISFHKFLNRWFAVIVIITHIKRMFCSYIKIGTVFGRRTAWPSTLGIHSQLWILSE